MEGKQTSVTESSDGDILKADGKYCPESTEKSPKYQASNSSKICHKNVKKMSGCSRYRAQHCKPHSDPAPIPT